MNVNNLVQPNLAAIAQNQAAAREGQEEIIQADIHTVGIAETLADEQNLQFLQQMQGAAEDIQNSAQDLSLLLNSDNIDEQATAANLARLNDATTELKSMLGAAPQELPDDVTSYAQTMANAAKSSPSDFSQILSSITSSTTFSNGIFATKGGNIYYKLMLILYSMYYSSAEITVSHAQKMQANTTAAKHALYAQDSIFSGLNQISSNSQLAALFASGGELEGYDDTLYNRIAYLEKNPTSSKYASLVTVWKKAKTSLQDAGSDFSSVFPSDTSKITYAKSSDFSSTSSEGLFLNTCNTAVINLNIEFSENSVEPDGLLTEFPTSSSLKSSDMSTLSTNNIDAARKISTSLNTISTELKTNYELANTNVQTCQSLLNTTLAGYKQSLGA